MTPDRHVVLIGLPGAGKTSIGRCLAKLLRRPVADADEQLELTAGRTLAQLVRDGGDDELHRQEQQVLADLVRRFSPLVISAPGAVEIGDELRLLLGRSAVVVWIRGPIPLLTGLGNPAHRPRLSAGHEESLVRLDCSLAPVYEDVADHIVDIEPFHTPDSPGSPGSPGSPDAEPKHVIARHILTLLDVPALPGEPPSPADIDPDRTLTDHILEQLAHHGIRPPNPR